ncbi:hypothetical protein U1Q18_038662 [Sarracenia purpurea var. burkii]
MDLNRILFVEEDFLVEIITEADILTQEEEEEEPTIASAPGSAPNFVPLLPSPSNLTTSSTGSTTPFQSPYPVSATVPLTEPVPELAGVVPLTELLLILLISQLMFTLLNPILLPVLSRNQRMHIRWLLVLRRVFINLVILCV